MTEPGAGPCDAVAVLGPTAAGKTQVAVAIARHFKGEIISADSRQVYIGCDIGSGKDREVYCQGGAPVPCHLIDEVTLHEEYNVFAFQRDFFRAYEEIRRRGVLPVIAGGTGLYLDAILRGYRMVEAPEDPGLRAELSELNDDALRGRLRELKSAQHNTTDLKDRARLIRAIEIAVRENEVAAEPMPALHPLLIGIRWPREVLRRRIRIRLEERMRGGLVEEVRELHRSGISWERLDRLGLEYRLVGQLIRGEFRREADMVARLTIDIGQFAKRQETWFRRMEKQGQEIRWIDGGNCAAAITLVEQAR